MTPKSDEPPTRLEPGEQAASAPVFLTVREAAALLRLSEITMARWRIEGNGPPHYKFGRRVVYARSDLIAWTEVQRRQSTSEPGSPYRQSDGMSHNVVSEQCPACPRCGHPMQIPENGRMRVKTPRIAIPTRVHFRAPVTLADFQNADH